MGITQADVDALLAATEGLASEAGAEPTGCEQPSGQAAVPEARPAASPSVRTTDLQRIFKLSLPVIVKLAGQEMPVKKVLQFKLGSIIEFDQVFDADLELIVGNRLIGLGQAVKAGENFGLRITKIGNITDTIKALGGR